MLVEDSRFSVGDDALCVKSGIDFFGRAYGRPARDVTFRRIHVGKGHGITVGSETSGGVANVTFEDITAHGTELGIRLKSQRGRGGAVRGITYRRVALSSIVQQCVQITLNYSNSYLPATNATATPVFEDLLLDNVSCTSASNSYLLQGLPESPIRGLRLRAVRIGPRVGGEAACEHVERCVCEQGTTPCPSCCAQGERRHEIGSPRSNTPDRRTRYTQRS